MSLTSFLSSLWWRRRRPTRRPPVIVVLYSKDNCPLCDQAKAILSKLQPLYNFTLKQVDITRDPALFEEYRYVIPVVEVVGRARFVSKISEYRLRRALAEGG